MNDDQRLINLFTILDTLANIARMMHPRRLPDLIATLGDQDTALNTATQNTATQNTTTGTTGTAASSPATDTAAQITLACTHALQACTALRAAPDAANPMLQAYRALRHYSAAQEALAPLADTLPAVSRYLLESRFRDDPALHRRLAQPPGPDTGVFHSGNEIQQRGGFSVFVPSWYDAATPAPVIMALHGGSGHGRLFLCNWLPEARSRGLIVVAPTAIGSTWSLMEPETDSQNLAKILERIRGRWNIDPTHMLLTGMSDGGTFTLISGLSEDSPFTHLAPVAASFHPLLLAMTGPERLSGLPIHLTHGAQDWMFPVGGARTAHRMLASAGAAITYREIADLSHAYPRDGQPEVLDWFLSYPTSITASTANAPSPSGIANTGFRSIDCSRSPAATANADSRDSIVGQRLDIRLLPPPRTQQQRRALDRADHRLRRIRPERAAVEHDVLQHLDEDPAQAEHRHRAEHRIAVDAQDALDAALQLFRDQHALDPGVRAPPPWPAPAAARNRNERHPASATSSSTPPISDLCTMSGDRIFITTGKPNRCAAATASSAVAQAASGADTIPAVASSRFASASDGVAAGSVTAGTSRRRIRRTRGERRTEAAHRLDRRHRAGRILMHHPAVGLQLSRVAPPER